MTRKDTFNFSAGPSVLPEEVLQQAQEELLNYHGTGMSVMEMSHRSQAFSDIFQEVQARFRSALSVPDTHAILFLQGGGTSQFSMIPLNLMGAHGTADYAVTGHFPAARQKKPRSTARCTSRQTPPPAATPASRSRASCSSRPVLRIFTIAPITPSTARVAVCTETGGVPLACDMSSDILSRPVDVSKYGVIFAGAQKNMAPRVTVAIVDRALAGHELPITPVMYSYQRMIDKNSMYNTRRAGTSTSSASCSHGSSSRAVWKVCSGSSMRAPRRCMIFLDNSALFHACAQPGSRSDMNVTFRTGDDALDKEFISACRSARPAQSQRDTALPAACAPRSITPCRWRAWMRSSII